ncbi:DUF4188 domain-containing protein [Psychromicrobium xiongbiense]|uniref:DUF4188 domain-containing protein n=1 Tax=Psychromicrobium xiongbiense TaxID=3051184 RepID=UPI00255240BB|nr:DUF4188 domain-containing protein [Psychromicrobium sp. YIM S02556]
MAPSVFPGRYTVNADGEEVTVFLIGMRINRFWNLGAWLPVFCAMPGMIARLASRPELGLLGYHLWFGRTTIMVSYWSSPDKLRAFASSPDQPHLVPWRRYMKKIGASGSVGVWHETYRLAPRNREAVYANMPLFGLARAAGHVQIAAGRNTFTQRMRSQE